MTRKSRRRRPRDPAISPVAVAMLRATIRQTFRDLKTRTELQAWAGADAATLVNSAGRMLFMVSSAAMAAGMDPDQPDCRVLRGMGEALGDLRADDRLEFHRPAIQAGLEAIDRLLPVCSDMALGLAAVDLEKLLASTTGFGTQALNDIFFKPKETA